MKIFIAIVHFIVGAYLIFAIYSPLGIFTKIQSPTTFYPDYSTSRIVTEYTIGILLALLSIIGTLGFIKNKSWSRVVLPTTTLGFLAIMLAPLIAEGDKTKYAWTGGIIIFVSLALFLFFILETAYIVFKEKVQKRSKIVPSLAQN